MLSNGPFDTISALPRSSLRKYRMYDVDGFNNAADWPVHSLKATTRRILHRRLIHLAFILLSDCVTQKIIQIR